MFREQPYIPSALILHEKHNTFVMRAETREALYASALSVVAGRERRGNCYLKTAREVVGDPPPPPSLTKEAAEALPTGPVRITALDEHTAAERYEKQRARAQRWIDERARILREKDGKAAWEYLERRRDHEYEGFELAPLQTVYPG